MTELLANHVAGRWQHGTGPGTELRDPVLGTALVRVDATGLNLPEAFAFSREQGGAALRAATYRERAAMLGAVAKVLQAHRDSYYDIATANSGTVKTDSAVDIDGGIFTLGQYARWGDALGDVREGLVRVLLLDFERRRQGVLVVGHLRNRVVDVGELLSDRITDLAQRVVQGCELPLGGGVCVLSFRDVASERGRQTFDALGEAGLNQSHHVGRQAL